MIRFLVLFFVLAGPILGAITEKYVSSLAAGGGDGTSGNPLTFTEMVTEINAGSAAGNRYNVKADGTYTRTASDTFSGSGTATSPVVVRGYSSVITDGYQGRTNDRGQLITTNMPLISYNAGFRSDKTSDWIMFENLNITGNVANTFWVTDSDSVMKSCRVVNASSDAAARVFYTGTRTMAIDCDFLLTGTGSGDAVQAHLTANKLVGCFVKITSTTAKAVSLQSASVLVNCIVIGGTGVHVSATSATPFIYGNTIVNSSADGINIITGTTTNQFIMNNLITDNTADGLDMTQTSIAGFVAFNRFRDNATSIAQAGDWLTATNFGNDDDGTTGDTSTDYENAASDDFRIKTTSPATSLGFPTAASIGAVQLDQTSVGGGGGETSHTFVQ